MKATPIDGYRLTLMYHNVTRDGDLFGRIGDSVTRYFVSDAQFAEHLECLATSTSRLYSTVCHHRVLANDGGGANCDLPAAASIGDDREMRPDRASGIGPVFVELTFDDGWAGSFEATLATLERFDMTATVFVTTGLIGQPHFADQTLIRDAVATGRFRIGAHGVTHRLLELLTPDEVDREMRESKETLESIIGAEVDTFALPGGSCSMLVRQIAKRLGYRELHNSVPSLCPLGSGLPSFEIPRFAIQRTTTTETIQQWLDRPLGFKTLLKHSTLDFAKTVMGRRRYAALRSRLLGSANDFDMTDLLPDGRLDQTCPADAT